MYEKKYVIRCTNVFDDIFIFFFNYSLLPTYYRVTLEKFPKPDLRAIIGVLLFMIMEVLQCLHLTEIPCYVADILLPLGSMTDLFFCGQLIILKCESSCCSIECCDTHGK